jgi:pyridoxal phosphate enzyme (YggS family)
MKRKLTDNVRRVIDRIANACIRARREPEEITLVAVTKYVGVDVIRQLLELGQRQIGESRAQELSRRAAMIKEMRGRLEQGGGESFPEPLWHMVGHLQRNKVKQVLPWVTMIHSVDSLRLAEEISHQAERLGRDIDVLVQVNAAGESQKFGVAVGAVGHLVEQIVSLPRLRVCGLMTMGPLTDDASRVAWTFERTAEIFEDLIKERFTGREFRHLSMGMTSDFELAVERGATMLRIGSALFEGMVNSE